MLVQIDPNGWNGALLCLYQLVKNYEYKKADERTPLTEAMNLLLPMIHQLMVNLMKHEQTEANVLLQKEVLKIYHALTQVRVLNGELGHFDDSNITCKLFNVLSIYCISTVYHWT